METEPADGPPPAVEVQQVETVSRPVRWLSRLIRELEDMQDIRCSGFGVHGFRVQRENMKDKWSVGDFGVTIRSLTVGPRFIPVGTYVVVRVSKPSSFITENEASESYMTSHQVVFEGFDKKGKRFNFSFWPELEGSSPIQPVTHEMTVIALSASGL